MARWNRRVHMRLPVLGAILAAVTMVVASCGGGTATPTVAPTATARPTSTPVPPTATKPAAPPTAAAQPTATRAAAPTATRAPAPTAAPQPTATPAPAPTAAGPQPSYGGILQARIGSDPATWDVYHPRGGVGPTAFVQNLASNLIRIKRGTAGTIEGDLAESWQVSSEGKRITFRLRPNATWSDGKKVTAADIKYNLQRATQPDTNFNAARVAVISAISTPDGLTMVLDLKQPSASLLPNLSAPVMLIYPAHLPDMAQWHRAPVGSGPFVVQSYERGQRMTLAKNPAYYGKDAAGRQLPYLNGINYSIIVDFALAKAAFVTGRLHCGCGFDTDFLTDGIADLKKQVPGLKHGIALGGPQLLYFNTRRPPLDNVLVRQAIGIGYDKEAVRSVVRDGTGYGPSSPLIPPERGGQWGLPREELQKVPGYNPNRQADVALSKEKFKQAGVNPADLSIDLIFDQRYGGAGDVIVTVLNQLGVKGRLSNLTGAENTSRLASGSFDMAFRPPGLMMDDPADYLVQHLASDGVLNFGKYSNPRVDQLLREQDLELDPARRRAMLWELQRIHLTEFPSIMMYFGGSGYGTRPEVFGYVIPLTSVSSSFRLEEVWLQP